MTRPILHDVAAQSVVDNNDLVRELETILPLTELLLVLVDGTPELTSFVLFLADWYYAVRRARDVVLELDPGEDKGVDLPFVSEWDRTEFEERLADYLTA